MGHADPSDSALLILSTDVVTLTSPESICRPVFLEFQRQGAYEDYDIVVR